MLGLNPKSWFSERVHIGPLELGEGLIWLLEAGLWIVPVWSPADMGVGGTLHQPLPCSCCDFVLTENTVGALPCLPFSSPSHTV